MSLNNLTGYEPKPDDMIETAESTYLLKELLGAGAYGKVLKCWRFQSNQVVAIKFLQNNSHAAESEIAMLKAIGQETADENNFVRYLESFQAKNQTCLVFENLEQSLFDFLYTNNPEYFPMKFIRPVAYQLLTALLKLQSLGIVHTDIKPANIMLVDTGRLPYKIKLIDFGCAIYGSHISCKENTITTLQYRSPEIFLGLPFGESIDMWSVGCVLAELFLGCPLFPGQCEYDMIRYITDIQGFLPEWLLSIAPKGRSFFTQDVNGTQPPVWRLKCLHELPTDMAQQSKESRTVRIPIKSFKDIAEMDVPIHLPTKDLHFDMTDRYSFADLLQNMLMLEQSSRITPCDALHHPFLALDHLQEFVDSDRYRETTDAMGVCNLATSSPLHHAPINPIIVAPCVIPAATKIIAANNFALPPPNYIPVPEPNYLPVQEPNYIPVQGLNFIPVQGANYIPVQGPSYFLVQGPNYIPVQELNYFPVQEPAAGEWIAHTTFTRLGHFNTYKYVEKNSTTTQPVPLAGAVLTTTQHAPLAGAVAPLAGAVLNAGCKKLNKNVKRVMKRAGKR